jgi:hypothetical protein
MLQEPIVFAVRDRTSYAVGVAGRNELAYLKICSGRLFLNS